MCCLIFSYFSTKICCGYITFSFHGKIRKRSIFFFIDDDDLVFNSSFFRSYPDDEVMIKGSVQ